MKITENIRPTDLTSIFKFALLYNEGVYCSITVLSVALEDESRVFDS